MRQRTVLAILVSLAVAVAAAAALVAHGVLAEQEAARDAIRAAQAQETQRAVAEITVALADVEAAADRLASSLAGTPLKENDIIDVLRTELARNADISAFALAFAPFAFASEERLAAPVVWRGDASANPVSSGRLEDQYDYTEAAGWYRQAMAKGRAWSGIERGPAGSRMIHYALRITFPGGQMAVLRASYPLARIVNVVALLELGHHGSAFLLSDAGDLLVSPGGWPASGENADNAIAELRRLVAKAWPAGGRLTVTDLLAAGTAQLEVGRVRRTRWTLATVYSLADLNIDHTGLRRSILLLTGLALLSLLFTAAAFLVRATRHTTEAVVRAAWCWSGLIGCALIVSIGVIWMTLLKAPAMSTASGEPITTRSALNEFKRGMIRNALLSGEQFPLFIPTGLFIQSLEFVTANNLKVTGYVWQRHRDDDERHRGVIMPEAESVTLEEAYRIDTKDDVVIGWHFEATLRQRFDYGRFPLDYESIWIRLWPKAFDENIFLVPDFDGYLTSKPNMMPGFERTSVIAGWFPVSTFFEYRQHSYNGGLGFTGRTGFDQSSEERQRAELYYNIEIKRNFLDPLVSHVTPVMLVLILIFAMQMTVTRAAAQKDLMGFNAATIITTCAALFFAVLIAHIEARAALAAKTIFYGEYFYLITYAVILLICVNAILFTSDRPIGFIQYRDNLLPKLLYWPLVLGAFYGVTFAIFY